MFSVQFITHFTESISYLESARLALAGGCRWIQLRVKDLSDEEIRETALQCSRLCREAGAVFILDDRVSLAKSIGADGVHLGKNDMPVSEARRILGDRFIIGGTANTAEDVIRLAGEGVSYIGCGPYRYTETKKKLAPILGIEGYRNILSEMKRRSIALPIVGIGGVMAEDMPLLKATGLTGIALSGSILRAADPAAEMKRVINIAQNL